MQRWPHYIAILYNGFHNFVCAGIATSSLHCSDCW